jgi:predicted transcriptional regulator
MKVQNSLKDSIGFVSESATLLDVKKEIDKREKCENVFVTKDGMNSGAVIGWITERDIYKHGKV